MDGSQVMLQPVRLLVAQLAILIPQVISAALILLVGWMLASLLRLLTVRLLRAMGLERLAEKAKLSEALHRGAIRLTVVELLGQLVYWLMAAASIMVALQFVGIAAAADWLTQLGAFVPRIIVSIVVLLFGMFFASFLGATVRAASLNAGFPQGHLAGQVVYTVVLLVTIIVALEQLQVVTRTLEVALYILIATCGLAFAIAFGLGSQGIVKRFLEDRLRGTWKSPKGP